MSVKLGDRVPVDERIVHHATLPTGQMVEVTHETMLWGEWERDPRSRSASSEWGAFRLAGLAVVFRLFV